MQTTCGSPFAPSTAFTRIQEESARPVPVSDRLRRLSPFKASPRGADVIKPFRQERLPLMISGFEGVLAAAQEGSDWAWEIIVRGYAPNLRRFFQIRGMADPDALVGEVLVDMARNIGTFTGEQSSFRSWVFVIAYRRLSDERRRLRRRPRETQLVDVALSSELTPSAEDEALQILGTADAERMLDVLTESQRDAISLRVIAGLTLAETAAIMGRPVGAVKGLQRRAISKLRRMLLSEGVSK
jgi:RNA polymerase sigma-70 factor (ECF subfamily)